MNTLEYAVAKKLGIAFRGDDPFLAVKLIAQKMWGGSGGSGSSGSGNISGDGSEENPYAITVPVAISASVSIDV